MQKNVNFELIGSKRVFTILTEPDSAQKKIVIMCHGFRGSSLGPARSFVDFEQLLIENGYSTLRFDQPCGGNSEGEFINSSFNEWVETIVYFAQQYLELGYSVALLGQSMGATATMVAVAKEELKNNIPVILLWVPDPKSTFVNDGGEIGEEAGQKYPVRFWQEAKDANFFQCLREFQGGIHLAYGENDRYVSEELRNKVIEEVKAKNQLHMVLPGQDHSPWEFDIAQKVYEEELAFLTKYI